IDQPAAGRHADRVSEEECRDDQSESGLGNAGLIEVRSIAGGLHAHPVVPANAGLLEDGNVAGGLHTHPAEPTAAGLLEDGDVPGGLHAHPVEPAHEAEREQERHDPPTDPAWPLLKRSGFQCPGGFTHIVALSAYYRLSSSCPRASCPAAGVPG